MTGLVIRKAKRSSAKPLIAFYSEGGGGKSRAALTLARGFVGELGRIIMIETESGRAETYAGNPDVAGDFDVIPMHYDPSAKDAENTYSPERYGEAISLAEKNKPDAMIIDSGSHEWEGIGGVLDWAARNQDAGKKGQQVWTQPKIMHQRHFISRLLMTPIPLVILCLRAKYPMVEKVVNGKKEMFRSDVLEPKQSADILYDIFCHGWFDRETHSFHATHYQDESLASVIRDGQKVTHESGRALARWASRDTPPTLASILTAIKVAETVEQLQAVVPQAAKLLEEDKPKAQEEFKAKKAELSK